VRLIALALVSLTATEVIARIQKAFPTEVRANTVDTFKAGNPETQVTGVAVTMMATLDVLQRAVKQRANLIITHEPTFYSHRDTTGALEKESDAVLAAKQKFIRDNALVIWRFHDIPHAVSPDNISSGVVAALGWQKYQRPGSTTAFDIKRTTLEDLASISSRTLGSRAARVSGDPSSLVSSVVITPGFSGFPINRRAIQAAKPDVVILGEDHEWETILYVVDAITAGQIKGLIVLGHISSEQAGMAELARRLTTIVPEVPVHFIATSDPFRPVR
jgi:putative NIF3 family GTP cyclohydrolase 1 type 2